MQTFTHPLKERNVAIAEGTIHYYCAGQHGPVVVLLHGGVATASISWKKLLPDLAGTFQVYAPDWPKYGGSYPYHGKATQEALEQCLEQCLDAWQVKNLVLVGHSMGGSVALAFALKYPERVTRLILVDSGGLQEHVSLFIHRLSYLWLRLPLLPHLAERLLSQRRFIRSFFLQKGLFKSDVADVEDIADELHSALKTRPMMFSNWLVDETRWHGLKTNHQPRLHELRCPTLLIHGSKDDQVPLEASITAARKIPQAELVVIEGAGHWPNREKPELFNAAVVRFLDPLAKEE